jgi:OOP family OmpA-OmpF porin
MLKRVAISTAILIALTAPPLLAEQEKEFQNWAAGFVQWYNADSDKPKPRGFFKTGTGVGGELGLRFDQNWAARFEITRQQIRVDPNKGFGEEETGTSFGADMVYFLNNDAAYVFGGARQQNLEDNYFSLAAGIGKHWGLTKELKIVTEAAVFHDFDNSFNDFGLKLGLAYTFGGNDKPVSLPVTDKDSDNDGVIDSRDQCPNTPIGAAVNTLGCVLPQDSDGDGVYNDLDQCPDTPRGDKVNDAGCTEFTESQVSVSLNVLFANDSDVVKNPADPKIVEFADFMRRYANTSATIEGHSSAIGPAVYNMDLSERRANAVVDVLVDTYGVERGRLNAVGFGETHLLDGDNTAQAHRLNRRIEAKVSTTVKQKLTN